MSRKRAQSILEYIIVLSAIIAVVIAAANGPIRNAVTQMFADSSDAIENKSTTFLAEIGQDR